MNIEISNVGVNEFLNVKNKEITKNSLKMGTSDEPDKEGHLYQSKLKSKVHSLGSIPLRKQSKYLNVNSQNEKERQKLFQI